MFSWSWFEAVRKINFTACFGPTHVDMSICGYMWIGQEGRAEMKLNSTGLNKSLLLLAFRVLFMCSVGFEQQLSAFISLYFQHLSAFCSLFFFFASQIRNGSCRQSAFFFVTANCNKIYFIRKCCSALDGIAVMHFGKFNF